MNDTSPEALGEFLRARAKYAKNTCERKGQISRVDALCWYLAHVSHASSRDVKRFMTAFKGSMSLYTVYDYNTRTRTTKPDLERAYALLNLAYGGVGYGFEGRVRPCMSGAKYGPVAPLYRPLPRTYAITVNGVQRAKRVQDYLDRAV